MIVHLHARSYYTLLNSTISIESLVNKSKSLGYKFVTLCEKNVMFSTVEFFKYANKMNIKPIIGLEFDCMINETKYPFILLAKNNNGYKNLIKLSSLVNGDRNFVTLDELKKFKDNCFLIVYGEEGYLESSLINDDENDLISKLDYLVNELGEFDVALSYNETPFWRMKNGFLKRVCKNKQIKTVALSKIYYLNKEDDVAYKIARGIALQKVINDKTLIQIKGRYLKDKSEMQEIYEEDDLLRTFEIASMCNVDLTIPKTSLPKFQIPNDISSKKYLVELASAGLKKRFNNKAVPELYIDRLKYELEIITKMDFEDYFLIVWDFIRFSKKHKIYVGPGRGSAAGSLVSYCLGITHIDPIKYNLLFERFLNPERISMPDIDIDFPDNKREEVINYVYNTYGKEHVAHIITFGTLKTKQVLRDVGRVLGINLRDVDLICKSVPNVLNITLKETYNTSPRFKQIINSDEKFIELFNISLKLEGMPRHTSMHAAGIVMSKLKLNDVIPTISLEQGITTTQFSMEYLEEFGLIKMDFLGLKNLTIIDEISDNIKRKQNSFDIMSIPLNDERTFKLLKDVDTVGVFQLESEGMKNLLRKMQPFCFEDIVATIALYRPGPMENIPIYLERRKNKDSISYPHKLLIPILKETYGIMIYQEQIMQIAQIMANFTLAKADILRKAMSKKNEEELKALENEFIGGCIKNNHSKKLAQSLYDLILKFAGYGFNKSHSVAYGLLAYQLAFLKANYPLEFFCSLLNSVINDESKTALYIEQCKKHNIKILLPDVNKSGFEYVVEEGSIRYPLLNIKGVGYAAVTQIIAVRNNGRFIDFYDFVARLLGQKVNKKIFESLIDSGALDNFSNSRKSMLLSLDEAISYGELVKVEINGENTLHLDLVSKPLMVIAKDDFFERSEREKNALGLYLSKHPISEIKIKNKINLNPLIEYINKKGFISSFACIRKVKQHRTKNGSLMAFLNVFDETSEFDLVIMPNLYSKYASELIKGKYIYFNGKIDRENSALVNDLKFMEN